MSSNSTHPQQRRQALPQGSPSLRSPYTLIVLPNRGQGSNSVCACVCLRVILSVRLCLQSRSLFGWQSYIVKGAHLIRWDRWEFPSSLAACIFVSSQKWMGWLHFTSFYTGSRPVFMPRSRLHFTHRLTLLHFVCLSWIFNYLIIIEESLPEIQEIYRPMQVKTHGLTCLSNLFKTSTKYLSPNSSCSIIQMFCSS